MSDSSDAWAVVLELERLFFMTSLFGVENKGSTLKKAIGLVGIIHKTILIGINFSRKSMVILSCFLYNVQPLSVMTLESTLLAVYFFSGTMGDFFGMDVCVFFEDGGEMRKPKPSNESHQHQRKSQKQLVRFRKSERERDRDNVMEIQGYPPMPPPQEIRPY